MTRRRRNAGGLRVAGSWEALAAFGRNVCTATMECQMSPAARNGGEVRGLKWVGSLGMCVSLLSAAAPILLVSMELVRLGRWLGREMAGPNKARRLATGARVIAARPSDPCSEHCSGKQGTVPALAALRIDAVQPPDLRWRRGTRCDTCCGGALSRPLLSRAIRGAANSLCR